MLRSGSSFGFFVEVEVVIPPTYDRGILNSLVMRFTSNHSSCFKPFKAVIFPDTSPVVRNHSHQIIFHL